MQLLPDRSQGKPLAIALAVLAAILVYLAGFHWFVVRHVELGREIGQLEEQIARFKGIAVQRPELEARLAELRRDRLDSALFLAGTDFSMAAAGLIRSLRNAINVHAEDTELCQVANTSPQRAREPERFEPVRVSVRMQCPLGDFVRVLYELENSVPLVFIDNLIVNQRFSLAQRGRRGRDNYGQLDVRFDMYGYLPEAGTDI